MYVRRVAARSLFATWHESPRRLSYKMYIYILEEALDLGGSDQSLSAISVIEYIIVTTLYQ